MRYHSPIGQVRTFLSGEQLIYERWDITDTQMENLTFSALVAVLLSLVIGSCSVVGHIFKAGMGFGFIVIATTALVVALMRRWVLTNKFLEDKYPDVKKDKIQ